MQGCVLWSLGIAEKKYRSIGKKISFMCSHTDSLTGANSPTMNLLFDHSKEKCDSDPSIRTKSVPVIVYAFNCFNLVTPIEVYIKNSSFIRSREQ